MDARNFFQQKDKEASSQQDPKKNAIGGRPTTSTQAKASPSSSPRSASPAGGAGTTAKATSSPTNTTGPSALKVQPKPASTPPSNDAPQRISSSATSTYSATKSQANSIAAGPGLVTGGSTVTKSPSNSTGSASSPTRASFGASVAGSGTPKTSQLVSNLGKSGSTSAKSSNLPAQSVSAINQSSESRQAASNTATTLTGRSGVGADISKQPPAGKSPSEAPTSRRSSNATEGSKTAGVFQGSSTTQLIPEWINNCNACKKPSELLEPHTTCCAKCRNYSVVDPIAKQYALPNLRSLADSNSNSSNNNNNNSNKSTTPEGAVRQAYDDLIGIGPATERIAIERQICMPLNNKSIRDANANKSNDKIITVYKRLHGRYEVAAADLEKSKMDQNDKIAALASALLKLIGSRADDDLFRARFFFTWIVHSIVYDYDAMTVYLDGIKESVRKEFRKEYPDPKALQEAETLKEINSWQVRTPVLILIKGFDGCNGFSDLFAALFNAVTPVQAKQAKYIGGYQREAQDTGPNEYNGHAWNSFGLGGQTKLIDVSNGFGGTSRGGKTSPMFDPSWFTKSNEEFARTHITDDINNTNPGNFWSRNLIKMPRISGRMLTIESSIQPQSASIAWTADQLFSIKRGCAHIKPEKMPCFFLVGEVKGREGGLSQKHMKWLEYNAASGALEATLDLTSELYRDKNLIELYGFVRRDDPGFGEEIAILLTDIKEWKDWKTGIETNFMLSWSRS